MGELIRVENLQHVYNENMANESIALHDINLTINEGEFVAIIGTNGSGKSTLAKHFNALLLPTSGSCRIDELETNQTESLWTIRQKVGMVFQNPDNQIVATLVEEDVAFGPENLGVESDEIKIRVEEALKAVDMEKYRKHAPHLLSGGQKQRVAIAGVLAMKTKCLVLDEPTAMLDPQGRIEVLETVKNLHKNLGITVVYITHFMEEAVEAGRVIVMKNGSILDDGTPKEIFTKVEKLKELGLDVPLAAQVAYQLKKAGIQLPDQIITNDELAVALCR
ncbi:energy-coupling factor transporter ATPase [Anaerosinus massiliensis]|uniref:energy-coupling factor transporter ATPase n=1 Tax=Massilibacillus massiliensis TaxID=1806837 RepID=UPI000ACCE46B|nr:energy-coupling factor transporter ATPase [Massilibacillus massiliensis]